MRLRRAAQRRAPLLLLAVGLAVATDDPEAVRLALPGTTWSLQIDGSTFRFADPVEANAGATLAFSGDSDDGVMADVVFDRMSGDPTAEDCRRYHHHRRGVVPRGARRVEETAGPDRVTVSYTVARYRGVPIDQTHVEAYLAHDGTCIRVHFSRLGSRKRDRLAVAAAAEGLQIRD